MPKVIAVIIYSTEIEIQTLFDSYVLIICNAKQTLFSSEPRQFHAHKLWTCHCHQQKIKNPTEQPTNQTTNSIHYKLKLQKKLIVYKKNTSSYKNVSRMLLFYKLTNS